MSLFREAVVLVRTTRINTELARKILRQVRDKQRERAMAEFDVRVASLFLSNLLVHRGELKTNALYRPLEIAANYLADSIGEIEALRVRLKEAEKRADIIGLSARVEEIDAERMAAEALAARYRAALEKIQHAHGSPYDEDYVTTTAREALADGTEGR